jgi:hypothetical protein
MAHGNQTQQVIGEYAVVAEKRMDAETILEIPVQYAVITPELTQVQMYLAHLAA